MFLRTLPGPLRGLLAALLAFLSSSALAIPQSSFFTYPGYMTAGRTTVISLQLSDSQYALANAGIALWDFSASGFQATGAGISNGCGGTLTFPSNTSLTLTGASWGYIYPPCSVSFEVTYVGTSQTPTLVFPPSLFVNPGSGVDPVGASVTICIVQPTVVSTVADSGPGSLRAAITTVNSGACAGQHDINFDIKASAPPWKIALASDLPAITPAAGSQVTFNLNNAASGAPPSVVLDGTACARGCSVGLQTHEYVQIYNVAIGGFKSAGVRVASGYTTLNDSYLGTDASGTAKRSNGVGLDIVPGASQGAFYSGVIIWNGIGVRAAGASSYVSQARIGVDANGAVAGNGIGLLASAGSASIYGSELRGNTGAGMALVGNAFGDLNNTIAYGNGGPALDLNNDGVTPNDGVDPGPYDSDTGPNGLLNYPEFTARYDGADTIVTGVLKTQPGHYQVALYENSVPRTTATGGEVLVDSLGVSTDPNGVATFAFTVAGLHDNLSMQTFICSEGCYDPSEYSPSVKTQLPGPGVDLSPRALDFGTRSVGTRSPSQPVLLLNNGTVDLTVRNITITGDFSFSSSCPITAPLPPGASCAIDVQFDPLVEGPRAGTLTVNTVDPGSPRTVALSGVGIIVAAGTLSIETPPIDFGAVSVGATSSPQLVHVTNTGNATLSLSWNATGPFAVVAAPPDIVECRSTLAPGASCDVAVVFMPTVVGGVPGSLVFASDGTNPRAVEPLSGQGIAGPPPRALTLPGGLDFGDVPFGMRSDGQGIAVTNASTRAVTITDVSATGDFSVDEGCATLAPRATCTITAYFKPTARGPRAGTITVRVAGDPDPYFVGLNGIGTANTQPLLSVTPSRLAFGNALMGPVGAPATVRLANVGEVPVVLSTLPALGDFLLTSKCGDSIAPGSHCEVDVRFYPRTTGLRLATLEIPSTAVNGPHRVELSGVGCSLLNAAHARLAQLVCAP